MMASLVILVSVLPVMAQQSPDAVAELRAKIVDPAFRFRAEQAGGGKSFAMQSIPEEGRQAAYDWLRVEAKPVKEQALECRLLAWLARELKRPAEEIQKADDLVLQAAPDLPEGWLNRAEFYAAASDKEPEKAAWALDTFAHGLRRVNFSKHDWRASLEQADIGAWLERAAQSGKLAVLGDALSDAMRSTPRGEAVLDAAMFMRTLLNGKALKAEPAVAEKLLDAIADAQPHLALGDALGYIAMAASSEAAGQLGVSRRIARLLALAPVPQEIAVPESVSRSGFALQWREAHPAPVLSEGATDLQRAQHELALAQHESRAQQAAMLREGWRILQLSWEDTVPRYLPMTQARALLGQALNDEGMAFTESALLVAKEQPWNEGLISHALLAAAFTDDLEEESLSVAKALDVEARGRLALRLFAFAPQTSLPLAALGPWLEEGAMTLLKSAAQGQPLERAAFSSVLQSMDGLERAGEQERLRRVLKDSMANPPRVLDADHWAQLSTLVLKHGTDEEAHTFAGTWQNTLADGVSDSPHLAAIAAAAVRGGTTRGADYASLALSIWQRRFAEKTQRTMEDAMAASGVAKALLACEDLEGFADFVLGLQKAPGANAYSVFARMTKELAALHELLAGEGDRLPAVDAWVQAPAADGGAPRVQWQFVLPELDSYGGRMPPIRIQVSIGDQATTENMSEELTPDGRWWAAGTSHPLLARLAGRYDLELLAGESPEKLRSLARVDAAASAGAVEVAKLPQSGCLRVMLRARENGTVKLGEARLFSLRMPLFSTGREPDASATEVALGPAIENHPSPATWTPREDERWGRFIGPPIAIEDGTEYLLTQWPVPASADAKTLPVQLILLDERQRPLGPVPLVSTGFETDRTPLVIYTQHRASTQRFRASNWGWAEDLVCLREKNSSKGEQTVPARYMAFVSRSAGDGALPLLQLRRFREPESGTGVDLASSSELTQMPELNGEYVTGVGFRVRSWHITMGPQRAIFTGVGRLAGFDVARIPWKPMMRVESHLLQGTEWPMCFASERALVVEPPWSGDRKLGVRMVPFGPDGKNYAACERRDLPLPNYTRGEISIQHDGAVMMLATQNREKPEPVAAWLFPDGRCSACPLPRPPLTGNPGLEVAWWGPPANQFTLHEDGLLFEMEVTDELRLLTCKPGSPDDMPPGARPPKLKKKPQWKLERPDILTEHDTTTGQMVRRFHLPQPCEAKPMSFSETSPVFLFTTEHDIIRVNPPPRMRK